MNKALSDFSIDELHKFIGRNVSHLRRKAGLSQLQLSLEMENRSPSLLSSAEVYKNKRHFNIAQLHKIAKILEIDICEFFKEQT